MRLHVHEWGDPDAPTVVCVHGVSAHGRRYRQAGGGTARGGLPRARARPARPRPVGLGAAVESRDAPGRPARDVRLRRGRVAVGRPQLRRPPRAGARRAHGRSSSRARCCSTPRSRSCRTSASTSPQEAAKDHAFASADEAIEARLASGSATPRAALEEEAREHLVLSPDGRLRWRYARAAVATMYSELCREPPPSTVLAGIPSLLVHAEQFGLVRDEQLEQYAATLGERSRARRRAGRPRRLLGRLRRRPPTRSTKFLFDTVPFHTRESPTARLIAGGNTRRDPGGRFSRVLQNPRAERARDQLDGQLGGLVLAVEDRVDLDHLERADAVPTRRSAPSPGAPRGRRGRRARACRRRARPRGRRTSMSRLTWTKPSPATCSSASRIAVSTPSRSRSLIVNTRASSSASRSRSPGSSERTPTSATRCGSTAGSRYCVALELRPAEPERRRERHPVDVAARRRLGPVQVAVRVEPEHAAGAARAGEAAERAERDRVVAAEHERQVALRRPLARPASAIRSQVALISAQVAHALVADGASPRRRRSRRCPSPRSARPSSRDALARAPRSGSPTGPCRRRAGRRRGRAPRR